tara:strand:- start:26 stop:205 length:180 start_codon:yes stop_codon:yes gene_type:complete
MNLKERGITVGDLLIVIILISIFFVVKVKKSSNDQSLMRNSITISKLQNFNILRQLNNS